MLPLAFPKLGRMYAFQPQGWTPDNRRVVYSTGLPYLIDNRRDLLFNVTFFPRPQPILLIGVPEDAGE